LQISLFEERFEHLAGPEQDVQEEDKIRKLQREKSYPIDEFWHYQARGLAVLATPDIMRTFRLPNRKPLAEVADRLHLTPLIRAMTSPRDVYVLAPRRRDDCGDSIDQHVSGEQDLRRQHRRTGNISARHPKMMPATPRSVNSHQFLTSVPDAKLDGTSEVLWKVVLDTTCSRKLGFEQLRAVMSSAWVMLPALTAVKERSASARPLLIVT
jgi:hypothetical protein